MTYHDGLRVRMTNVVRANGLRVALYVNDHLLAHVHAFGDGEAKVTLLGADGMPDMVWADAVTRGKVRRTLRVVVDHLAFLLQRWEHIRGRAL